MPSKDGWTHERDHDKVTLGKKQYRNMEEWSRPCAVCAEKFFIYVRTGSASVNASFGLRTCKDHRGQKLGTPGTAVFEQHEELERLKDLEQTFHAILWLVKTKFPDATYDNLLERMEMMVKAADDLFAGYKDLNDRYEAVFAENSVLKGRLSAFDLPAAMAAAKESQNKLPWDT